MTRRPVTPDGRYLVVRGRLWRCANPALDPAARQALVNRLMAARRAVRAALQADDADALREARRDVHVSKVGLGERGSPWWSDGAVDMNRRMAVNTPYADWYRGLQDPSADVQ